MQGKVPEHFNLEQLVLDVVSAERSSGTPCFFDNMDYINKNGLSIYIKKPAKFLAERLRNAKSVRPLFRGISNEDMLSYITTQLVEREYYYMKAKVVVQQQGPKEIINILEKYKEVERSLIFKAKGVQ